MTAARTWTLALAAIAVVGIGCSGTPDAPASPLDNGSEAGVGAAPDLPPTTKPAAVASTHPTYTSCAALREDFPDGVRQGTGHTGRRSTATMTAAPANRPGNEPSQAGPGGYGRVYFAALRPELQRCTSRRNLVVDLRRRHR